MSINQIHELRKKSNQFVANLNNHVGDVVEHNEKLLQLNKAQLKASETAKGGDLINTITGSPFYSDEYAKKKTYRDPDLFVTGTFYKEMDLIFNEPREWFITSFAKVTKHLREMYGDDIFGIQNTKKAQKITVKELREKYKRLVL